MCECRTAFSLSTVSTSHRSVSVSASSSQSKPQGRVLGRGLPVGGKCSSDQSGPWLSVSCGHLCGVVAASGGLTENCVTGNRGADGAEPGGGQGARARAVSGSARAATARARGDEDSDAAARATVGSVCAGALAVQHVQRRGSRAIWRRRGWAHTGLAHEEQRRGSVVKCDSTCNAECRINAGSPPNLVCSCAWHRQSRSKITHLGERGFNYGTKPSGLRVMSFDTT